MVECRVISIGTLAENPLWGEQQPVRTGHATTTLVRTGKRLIVVDPGLPDQIIGARFGERTGLKASMVTDVFLTRFHPDCRRGITAFSSAEWWISEVEREAVGVPLARQLAAIAAEDEVDAELQASFEREIALLQRCKPAPDQFADHVSLFPLPGVTPGLTGLLLEQPRFTTLICGDAVATAEHLERGQVLQGALDVERARESFSEAVEIADMLVLGRDNLTSNPTKRPF